MFDYFRAGLARSSSGLPRTLTKWPYDALLSLLKRQVSTSSADLWVRNSLALDYWELGLSDLDISMWTSGGIQEGVAAWQGILPHKRLLIGGEVQIYTETAVRDFLPYANPWELRRDPHLIKRLGLELNLRSPIHQTVFLARMIQADEGLRRNEWSRQRKWHEHLKAMGIPAPSFITWDFLVDLLQRRAPFSRYSKDELSGALMTEGHDSYQADGLDRLLKANHHVWDDIVRADDLRVMKTFDESAHAFLAGMMEWEIWGVSSLAPLTCGQDLALLGGYWRNQQRLIQLLKIPETQKAWLKAGFEKLAAYYQPLSG